MDDERVEEQQSVGRDENGLKDVGDFGKKVVGKKAHQAADVVKDYAEEQAKKAAREAAKKTAEAAKQAAKKMAELIRKAAVEAAKLAAKAIQGLWELINCAPPWSEIITAVIILIIVIIIWVVTYDSPMQSITDSFESATYWWQDKTEELMGGIQEFWEGVTDPGDYEDEIDEYNGKDSLEPLDVDKGALWLQKLKDIKGEGDEATSSNPDELGTVDETFDSRLMSKNNNFYTQENLIYAQQLVVDYNNQMFRYFKQYYEYKQWVLKEYYRNGILQGLKWQKDYRTDDTTDDGLFEKLSRIHIEGEKDENGEYRFAVHWQDVVTAMVMKSMYHSEPAQWGEEEDGSEAKKIWEMDEKNITQVNEIEPEAFLTEGDIKECFDLFKYKFDYYYGTTEELSKHDTSASKFKYLNGLREGKYQLGYRYKRLPDPVDDENHDGPDYSSPSDVPSGMEAPYTKFVPEQAPNTISNSYEAYKYVYVDIDEVPDYTPDPDVYEPPDGIYCIGRWHVTNPKPFIEALDTICPFFRDRYEAHGWDWVHHLVDEFNEHEEILPRTGADYRTQSRADFFSYLADLYVGKTIVVSYEGTEYDGMDEFVSDLEAQYPGWHVVWDEDYVGELNKNLKKKLRKDDDTGEIGSTETEGGGQELTEEELSNASEDVMLLANVLFGEGGTNYAQNVAVGTVIMNRVKSSRFPNTLEGVITAPRQFDGYKKGRSNAAIPTSCINTAYNILYNGLRMKDWADDVIGFQNPYISSAGFNTRWNNWYKYAVVGSGKSIHWFYSLTDHGDGHESEPAEGEDSERYDPIVSDDARSGGTGTGVVSNVTGEFYPAFADPNTYPFWSYGVTFHSLHGYGNNFLNVADDEFENIADWVVDYEGVRLRDEDEMIPDGLTDDVVMLTDFLELYYMNQATSGFGSEIRGISGETYKSSGCLDTTVAMILSWWSGSKILPTSFKQYVNRAGALDAGSVLRKSGLMQSGNIYGDFANGVKAEIDAGRPPIVHIRGHWGSYHTTSNGHFLTIVGYDKTGFYVADPGKSANHHIPYEDWASVNDLYYRRVTKI